MKFMPGEESIGTLGVLVNTGALVVLTFWLVTGENDFWGWLTIICAVLMNVISYIILPRIPQKEMTMEELKKEFPEIYEKFYKDAEICEDSDKEISN